MPFLTFSSRPLSSDLAVFTGSGPDLWYYVLRLRYYTVADIERKGGLRRWESLRQRVEAMRKTRRY